MDNSGAIGIFDSGLGGISIASALHTLAPYENITYIADSDYTPYGNKSCNVIRDRAFAVTQQLIDSGAKCIVVACNTATMHSITLLRSEFNLPIIGVEPGVRPAALASKSGRIAVLATEQTIASTAYKSLKSLFSKTVDIYDQPCPDFVQAVENWYTSEQDIQLIADRYVKPLVAIGCDQIVLGCTHFSFLKKYVQRAAGAQVNIIDTSVPVASRVTSVLAQGNLAQDRRQCGLLKVIGSDDRDKVAMIAKRLSNLEFQTQ